MNTKTIPVLSLADMAYSIANEKAIKKDGTPLDITYSEKILREWANSDDPRIQEKFMELVLQKQITIQDEESKPGGLDEVTAKFFQVCLGLEDYPGQLAQLRALEPEQVKSFITATIAQL